MGTGSFPGVKRPGRGVDSLLPSSAEVIESVELYLYPPLGLRGLFNGEFYIYVIICYAWHKVLWGKVHICICLNNKTITSQFFCRLTDNVSKELSVKPVSFLAKEILL